MTIVEEKDALRRAAATAVAALGQDERANAHRAIVAIILALAPYRNSEQVLAYQPLADEVDVLEVVDAAEREGRAVYFPSVSTAGNLVYRRWHADSFLVRGTLGVLEPTAGDPPRDIPSIVLVPGRAFSPDGWRIGRGGGYYDRTLPGLARYGRTVGVAYGCQVLRRVAHDAHDVRVDLVVSERGIGDSAPRGGGRRGAARFGD